MSSQLVSPIISELEESVVDVMVPELKVYVEVLELEAELPHPT